MARFKHSTMILCVATLAVLPSGLFAANTTPPIDGGNNDPGDLNPVGAEPAVLHSFVRDSDHDLAATDTTYAKYVADSIDDDQYGSADFVMAQCFGGGFSNDIAAQGFSYTFASASGYNEPSWSKDTVGQSKNINFNGTVDNFTRAYNAAANSPAINANAQATMLNMFNAANLGQAIPDPTTNAPVAVAKDPFSRPTSLVSGAEERPQYSSSGAAADDRSLVNDPNGAGEFAILVAWDVPDPRHALNIDLIYNTLINVDKVPADHIAVLFPENAPYVTSVQNGGNTTYYLPNAFPNAPGNVNTPVPIDADNTGDDFENALAGDYFGTEPTSDDKLFVYNTGHGGHTAAMEPGTVGNFHSMPASLNAAAGDATDVRYLIPVSPISGGGGGFGVPGKPTVANPMSQGDPEYPSIGGIPDDPPGGTDPIPGDAGDISQDRLELIFKPGTQLLNLGNAATNVQVQLNGSTVKPLPTPAAPQFNCDDILTGGQYVYCTVDFPASEFVPLAALDPDNIVIDLLNLDPTQQSANILYAVDLIGGDQESLFVVVPEPAVASLLIATACVSFRRNRRS